MKSEVTTLDNDSPMYATYQYINYYTDASIMG